MISSLPATALSDPESEEGNILRRAKLLRALNHNWIGDTNKTVAELQEILRYLPSDKETKNRLAAVWHDDGDATEALKLVQSRVLNKHFVQEF